MSEETAAGHADENLNPSLSADASVITIERNGITLALPLSKIKRGDDKGKKYPSPEINRDNVKDVLAWFGMDTVVDIISAKASALFQGFRKSCTSESGLFDLEAFKRAVTDLKTAALSKSQLEELIANATAVMVDMDFTDPDLDMDKVKELQLELRRLREQHAARTRAPRKRKSVVAEDDDSGDSDDADPSIPETEDDDEGDDDTK